MSFLDDAVIDGSNVSGEGRLVTFFFASAIKVQRKDIKIRIVFFISCGV